MRPVVRACVGLIVLALAGSACGEAPRDEQPDLAPQSFADSIDVDDVVDHLDALERIAKENDGNRAAGTSGYDASLDYVVGTLQDSGFDVQTPEFQFATFDVKSDGLSAGGRDYEVRTFTFSPPTPESGVRARVVALPADAGSGCEGSDYDGVDVTGAIVIVQRGECQFVQKESVAADRGAAAMLVAFAHDSDNGGSLSAPDTAQIPVARLDDTDVAAVLAAGEATLRIDAETVWRKTRNVIAQTRTGATDNVVMVGAHLDSVPAGPGINDNGSGAATILDIATELGSDPKVTNAVRFAWWGAEELGLLGSSDYVDKLSGDDRDDIALYLNFDMLGSPNPGYLTYDGDNSDGVGEPAGPIGSDAIERTFNAFFYQNGVAPEGTDFSGRSDYGPFVSHGIPAGGVFSGAESKKTVAQQEKWGGTAEEPFDPNYHSPGDTLANIDRDALELNAAAAAWGVVSYALDTAGPNGVPGHADRQAARGDDK